MPAINIDIKNLDNSLPLYKDQLTKELGDNWWNPPFIRVWPYFVAKQRDLSVKSKRKADKSLQKLDCSGTSYTKTRTGRGDEAERRLHKAAFALETVDNGPQGYFMVNTNLPDYYPEDELEMDGIFVSKDVIIVFEVKDYDNIDEAIDKASAQLHKRVKAIQDIANGKIRVIGAIVFPFIENIPENFLMSSDTFVILQENDLFPLNFSAWIKKEIFQHFEANAEDQINAMAKIMLFVYLSQRFPATEVDAVLSEAEKITLQRFTNYRSSMKPTFNSIQFTTAQVDDAKDICKGNTVICGGYGTGKTVTLIRALQQWIEDVMKKSPNCPINVLFISAQGFLGNSDTSFDLHYSPFLEQIKKWIKEAIEKLPVSVEIKDFGDCGIDSKVQSGDFIEVCLLTDSILDCWSKESTSFLRYTLVILEEGAALSNEHMNIILNCVRRAHVLTWITSSFSGEQFNERYPDVKTAGFKFLSKKCPCLRSTLEIVKFYEAFEAHIVPERFPSLNVSADKMFEGIPLIFSVHTDEKTRFTAITQTIQKWLYPPERRRQIFIVDCEKSDSLFSFLTEKEIPASRYKDYGKHSLEILCLQPDLDPAEAILSGGEWPALIIHCKGKTLFSDKVLLAINKRILSRAISKVYFFTDQSFETYCRSLSSEKQFSDEFRSVGLVNIDKVKEIKSTCKSVEENGQRSQCVSTETEKTTGDSGEGESLCFLFDETSQADPFDTFVFTETEKGTSDPEEESLCSLFDETSQADPPHRIKTMKASSESEEKKPLGSSFDKTFESVRDIEFIKYLIMRADQAKLNVISYGNLRMVRVGLVLFGETKHPGLDDIWLIEEFTHHHIYYLYCSQERQNPDDIKKTEHKFKMYYNIQLPVREHNGTLNLTIASDTDSTPRPCWKLLNLFSAGRDDFLGPLVAPAKQDSVLQITGDKEVHAAVDQIREGK